MTDATIVDVWAPWCRPCRTMEPLVDRAAESYAGRVALEKVNADEAGGRLDQLTVRAVPTLIALRNGEEIARLTGAQSEVDIRGLFALAAGDRARAPRSSIDRKLRGITALLLVAIGLATGAVPLLVVGSLIALAAIPRRRLRRPGTEAEPPPYTSV